MTKFVYCVFLEAMRNDIPVDTQREHVWPAMSDYVNTSAGEVRGKKRFKN